MIEALGKDGARGPPVSRWRLIRKEGERAGANVGTDGGSGEPRGLLAEARQGPVGWGGGQQCGCL